MKLFKKSLVLSACLFAAAVSEAQTTNNFYTTNQLSSANITNLNGFPQDGQTNPTGTFVSLGNAKDGFALCLQGYLKNSASATVGVGLVSSSTAGAHPVANGTNGNDWSTSVQSNVLFTLPIMTNWFNAQVFIPFGNTLADATFIGVYSLTNNLSGANVLVNSNNNLLSVVAK